MTLTQYEEHEDGSVTVLLDMTPEEHRQLLEAAVTRALRLAIEEKDKTAEEYKNERV